VIQLPDALAISFAVGAAAAFVLGELAFADTADLRAIYWLAVGTVSLRAAVQLGRRGAKT